jgi:hypothetical protein
MSQFKPSFFNWSEMPAADFNSLRTNKNRPSSYESLQQLKLDFLMYAKKLKEPSDKFVVLSFQPYLT